MQTVEQNGYTHQEILDVCQFKSGSRTMTFRYEQLDQTNAKIRDMTNVLECDINESFLDDVKRTASFTIADDGTIDYGSDRIKPWARVDMPYDSRTFIQVANSYNGIQTGEYNFNETVTGGGAVNAGLGGTAMNGVIGGSVSLGNSGVSEGSSFIFPAATGAPNQVRITNGGRYVANVAGSGGFTVANEFAFTIFINLIPNGALGKVWQTSTGSAYLGVNGTTISFVATTATGTVNVTCPNPYGTDMKFIGVSRRVGIGTQIYVNGIPQQMTVITDDVSNVLTGGGDMYIGGDVNMFARMDSLTWYNAALNDGEMNEIYRAGRQQGPFSATNYAEWPQGVFLLSAPTRSEDNGKSITRAVQGFSGEQQFIDDVVTSRYTALAGVTTINNILGLVLSYVPMNLGVQDSTYWNNVSNNTSFSATGGAALTVAGPTVTGGLNNYATNQVFTSANMDVRMNFTLPSSGNGTRGITLEAGVDGTHYTEISVIWSSGRWNLATAANGAYIIAPGALAYDSVAMAYLRMWESQGIIYFQYSVDNANWVTVSQAPAMNYLSKVAYGPFLTGNGEPAWSVTFNLMSINVALQRTVNLTPSTAFPSAPKDYDPGTTKLAIINDQLSLLNYNSLYHDENGIPQLIAIVDPATRPPEYVYADDDTSVTLPEKSETFDLYNVPNVFVLVASNPDSTLYTATWINDNPASPTSTISRGRQIVHYELESDATDLLTLQLKAQTLATQAGLPYDEIDFTTAIMPFHSSNDVYGVAYSDLSVLDKFNEIKWSFTLKDGETMKHSARRQVQI